MPWKLILFVIVIVLVALFVGVNHANVCNISLIFTEFQNVPVYVTILISFIIGMLIMLPFTIGKKRGKYYKQQKKNAANNDFPVREEYPAETSRNRRNRKRQGAAARKAARNPANAAGGTSTEVVVPVTSGAEIPAITDGSSDNKSTKGKGFFGLFSKKEAVQTGTDDNSDVTAAATDSDADKKPEEKK